MATTMSTPGAQASVCGSSGTPPYTATRLELGVLGVLPEALLHLDAQLARRREDERARAVRPADQPVEDRQRERGGLAGARLREAHDVAALERQGDRQCLNWRRIGVSSVLYRLQHIGVKPEVCE